jgi:hypothetical protein
VPVGHMQEDPNIRAAAELMEHFAQRTGLEPQGEPRRYLWTDAFAVCNLLELHRLTDDCRHLDLALLLVDQVHRTLGRHRPDDDRKGWISALSEEEGARHPTAGGLRIGKRMNERDGSELPDYELEWDRDGQYFHYLTKWMHALARVAEATGEARYLAWSTELAVAAWGAFAYSSRSGRRLRWKMSIDLQRTLVPSMGQHDPLDGYVTFRELLWSAALFPSAELPDLSPAVADLSAICRSSGNLATSDPLGAGGLLIDAWRMAQMTERRRSATLNRTVEAAGISVAVGASYDGLPASRRLAFRELGLVIGLEAAERLGEWVGEGRTVDGNLRERIDTLQNLLPQAARTVRFWSDPANQAVATWREHQDISSVMLATALVPSGLLTVPATARLL